MPDVTYVGGRLSNCRRATLVTNKLKELEDLRFAIAQEMTKLEPDFHFYQCITYRELIVQALRFGERIQVILDRILYPSCAVAAGDLAGHEESAGH